MKKVCFIIFNFILILLMIIFIIFIPYGFIYDLGFFLPILTIVNCIKYQNHIQRYPLNDLKEYQLNVLQDDFALYNENNKYYFIEISYSEGIYRTNGCAKKMIFDMKKCIFPKNYLRAYFVRNIHFLIIKHRKLSLRHLSRSLKVMENFKYQNLKIIFIKENKRKEYWIVKNGKTKINIIIADIIGNVFSNMIIMNKYSHSYDGYKKLSEKYYANNKKYYK
ncbi:MAG: hypothetical protein SOZ32_00185 [Bacilli bacterium]|nr:hypothetical protein [Mollicutes bacterium]MDY3898623.1 hypothetical protein [Bacilli bacterium]